MDGFIRWLSCEFHRHSFDKLTHFVFFPPFSFQETHAGENEQTNEWNKGSRYPLPSKVCDSIDAVSL